MGRESKAQAMWIVCLLAASAAAAPPGAARLEGRSSAITPANPSGQPVGAGDEAHRAEAKFREALASDPAAHASGPRGACTANQVVLNLQFFTDDFGSDTTWQVVQRGGNIIASGGPYASNAIISEDVCVDPSSCYDITLFDSYGDGLVPPAFYEVYWDGVLVDRGDAFGFSIEVRNLGGGCPPLDPVLECPADSLYGSRVHEPTENWFAGLSELEAQGAPFVRADAFSGLSGPVCGLSWWGFYGFFFFGFEPCDEPQPDFDIVIYEDQFGAPGDVVCSYSVTAAGVPTGLFYGTWFEMQRFDVALPSCCNVRDGWVSVQGKGDLNCWFLWLSRPLVDGANFIWNDDQALFDPGDLAFCLGGTTTPGACCNPFDATCTDNVAPGDCAPGNEFHPGATCAELDPPCGGFPGACCDDVNEICTDGVLAANCTGRHEPLATCATMDPACGDAPGACCYPDGRDCAILSFAQCTADGGAWAGVDAACDVCPCIVTCPEGALPEQDACGDDTNYGCDGFPPAFQDIALGDTICGAGFATGNRDNDWYRFTLDEPSIVTVGFEGEFGERVIFGGLKEYTLDGTGSGECADLTGGVLPVFNVTECQPAEVVSDCLPPGTYFAFVAPVDFDLFPCGDDNAYVLTVTAEPCTIGTGACCRRDGTCADGVAIYNCADDGESYQGDGTDCENAECVQPQPGDWCPLPIVVEVPAGLPYIDSNGSCGRVNDYDATCLDLYDDGEDILYQLNVATTTSLQVRVDPHGGGFNGLVIDDACPPGDSCRAMDTSNTARVLDLGCRTYEPGSYYVMADTWPAPFCNNSLEIEITPCVPVAGACCGDDLACLGSVTQEECIDVLGGAAWYGGEDCGSFACPPPPADFCSEATAITSLPYFRPNIDPSALSDDFEVNPACDSNISCGPSAANNGWWYTLLPKSDCSLEFFAEGLDAAISLWTGPDCDNLDQVDCSSPETGAFELEGGQRYWVVVSNWSCFFEPVDRTNLAFGGTCAFVCGDVAPAGGDGAVGMDDYQAFLASFGQCVGADAFNAAADLDGDGCVTWVDYQAWLTCYREANTAPTGGPAVPGQRARPSRSASGQSVLRAEKVSG